MNSPAVAPTAAPPQHRTRVPVSWLVVIVLVVAGSAVGVTVAYYTYNSPAASGTCTSNPSSGNFSITDDLGRCVTAPYNPARVAVLSPSIMDPVYRLGLRSHVVAVDCYADAFGGLTEDYSSDQIQLWNLTQSMCVQVGPTFSLEDLANATPQLVLASTIISLTAVDDIETTLGIPVVMLQPATVSGILTDVTLIGEIFGISSAASALNAQLTAELANASATRVNDPTTPSVLVTYDVDSNGYWTFGAGTFGTSLINLSGAASISGSDSNPYPELPAETVLAANPAFVVYGTGFGLNESYYAGGPDWSSIPAVESGHAVGLDSNYLTEPDPTMILVGLPVLLTVFHP
ncbi:MAG: ABC transporter substrate-binding protein [Thermoplasmata archaeon]